MEKIAVIMKKIKLPRQKLFFFLPYCAVIGEMKNNTLRVGNTYYHKIEDLTRKEFYGVAFMSNAEIMREKYEGFSEKEMLDDYYEECLDAVYFGWLDEKTKKIVMKPYEAEDLKAYAEGVEIVEESFDFSSGFVQIEMEKINEWLNAPTLDKIKEDLETYAHIIKEAQETIEPQEKSKVIELPTHQKNPKKSELQEIDANKMYEYVSSRVINQDDAIRRTIATFILNRIAANQPKDSLITPGRTLITGPSGSGKTMILDTIATYMKEELGIDIPLVKIPTSQLTVAGYVGSNLEDILISLMDKCKGKFPDLDEKILYVERNGVVFLDEIDKKIGKENDNVSFRGVLNTLLQFLDGTDYTFSYKKPQITFNTKFLNIFLAGSFSVIREQEIKKPLGFQMERQTEKPVPQTITITDIIEKAGMPVEFAGRITNLITLNALDRDDLKNILTTSKASALFLKKQQLGLIHTDLTWTDDFIEAVAKKAYETKVGARALNQILSQALTEVDWMATSNLTAKTIQLTEATLEDPKQLILK